MSRGKNALLLCREWDFFFFFLVKEGVLSSQHPQTGRLCSEQALERGTKKLSREKFSIRPTERHGNKPFYTKQNDPKESKGRTPKKNLSHPTAYREARESNRAQMGPYFMVKGLKGINLGVQISSTQNVSIIHAQPKGFWGRERVHVLKNHHPVFT